MAKQRVVDTNFWSDNYIVKLDPLERYLYLYLLTNEHTNICGFYELPLRVMAFESAIDQEMLPKMIARFNGKIEYIEPWVCIKNFIKHQSTKSKTVQAGIQEQLQKIPQEVIDRLIGYGYPIHRVSKGIIYTNTNINTNTNPNDSFKNSFLDERLTTGLETVKDIENLKKLAGLKSGFLKEIVDPKTRSAIQEEFPQRR